MKVVQINTTCGVGSTGKICVGISQAMTEQGIENYILYSSKTDGYSLGIGCTDDRYLKVQALKSRVFGNYGFNSRKATKKMIAHLDKIKPDIVHLHNLHGHDCHLGLLLSYLKKNKIKTYWTFHDCWTMTAYCPHFAMAGCKKWKTNCEKCPLYKEHSWFLDKSKSVFTRKRKAFQGLDLTVVTPSKWLASVVKQSFLKDVPVKTVYSGVDLSVFQPTPSDFRKKYRLDNKKIVLGVAFDWSVKKGLDVMERLANTLSEDYAVVMVGANDQIAAKLPKNVITIARTQNQQELAEIYTAADVFVNPTREEVLGLTNIEANACGTPVITFNAGGSPECISSASGCSVEIDDFEGFKKAVVGVCEEHPFSPSDCRKRAEYFDRNERYREYVALYQVEE
jgi:glycosyltransferase involved in cell wall biosynthesis